MCALCSPHPPLEGAWGGETRARPLSRTARLSLETAELPQQFLHRLAAKSGAHRQFWNLSRQSVGNCRRLTWGVGRRRVSLRHRFRVWRRLCLNCLFVCVISVSPAAYDARRFASRCWRCSGLTLFRQFLHDWSSVVESTVAKDKTQRTKKIMLIIIIVIMINDDNNNGRVGVGSQLMEYFILFCCSWIPIFEKHSIT